ARDTLARALRGQQVDKPQLDAAKSLFSYRADAPPHDQARVQESRGKPVGLADLVRVAAECGIVTGTDIRVGGEPVRVGSAIHTPPTERASRDVLESSSPLATNKHSQPAATEPGAGFDDSTASKLKRRYGDDTAEGYRW